MGHIQLTLLHWMPFNLLIHSFFIFFLLLFYPSVHCVPFAHLRNATHILRDSHEIVFIRNILNASLALNLYVCMWSMYTKQVFTAVNWHIMVYICVCVSVQCATKIQIDTESWPYKRTSVWLILIQNLNC